MRQRQNSGHKRSFCVHRKFRLLCCRKFFFFLLGRFSVSSPAALQILEFEGQGLFCWFEPGISWKRKGVSRVIVPEQRSKGKNKCLHDIPTPGSDPPPAPLPHRKPPFTSHFHSLARACRSAKPTPFCLSPVCLAGLQLENIPSIRVPQAGCPGRSRLRGNNPSPRSLIPRAVSGSPSQLGPEGCLAKLSSSFFFLILFVPQHCNYRESPCEGLNRYIHLPGYSWTKAPHTRRLKTTGTHPVMALEAESPKSRCQQGGRFPETLGGVCSVLL